ncbi:hypothetical protein DIURU_005622 [Diutina rugosa]|uniref:Uncharacterized protein n=1 Tax=Diutina rugosa TaxID=5481 RepID=A0A642UEV2_DIURU|nr:uncharacterized protein DIURU_005622 [Diutina rugosa]KAA8896610.1 hypothetical protein DIURU_005622 [Diutina rugosa]
MLVTRVLQALVFVYGVVAVSYREFHLTPARAGACVMVESVSNATALELNLQTPYLRPLPLIIGDYRDGINVPQWPNLDEFYNDTYIKGSLNRLVDYSPATQEFTFKRRSMPDHWVTETFNQKLTTNLTAPGVFCLYVPKSPENPPYLISVKVVDEPLVIELPGHLYNHLVSMALSVVAITIFKLIGAPTPIANVVAINLIVMTMIAATEYLCLQFPLDTSGLQEMLSDFIYIVENNEGNVILASIPLALISAYSGFRWWFPATFTIYLSGWVMREVVFGMFLAIPQEFQVKKISVNGIPWDVVYQSVVTFVRYADSVKPYLHRVTDASATAAVVYFALSMSAIVNGTIALGFVCLWRLRKKTNEFHAWRKSVNGAMLVFFAYYVVGKKMLMQLPQLAGPLSFGGASDFAEVLVLTPMILAEHQVVETVLDFVGVLLVWGIWWLRSPKEEGEETDKKTIKAPTKAKKGDKKGKKDTKKTQ